LYQGPRGERRTASGARRSASFWKLNVDLKKLVVLGTVLGGGRTVFAAVMVTKKPENFGNGEETSLDGERGGER